MRISQLMSAVPKPDDSGSSEPVQRPKRGVPEGLWMKCDGCNATVYRKTVDSKLGVCPECGHHFYVSAAERIRQLLDEESFEEWFS